MSRFTEYQPENNKLSPVAGYWTCKVVSLEEALAPFFDQINGLQRSIREIKKFCHYPSVHNVTQDESAALMLYTMETGEQSFYYKVNEALRKENRKELIPWFPYLKLLDSILSKMPTVKGSVWRGVRGNVTENLIEGQIITWWSISSCSTSTEVVEKFLSDDSKSTLFMIEVKNGKNVADYTMFPDEKEVILGIGTRLRVKNTGFQRGNLLLVHLEELESSSDDDLMPSVEPIPNKPKNSNGGKNNPPPIEIKFGVPLEKKVSNNHPNEFNIPTKRDTKPSIDSAPNLNVFRIWWLDSNVHSNQNQSIQKQLRTISEYFQAFKSESQFEQSIKSISSTDRVLLIVSGSFGYNVVPRVHSLHQVTSIYVYCENKQLNEQWASKYSKVKGVITESDQLIAHIQADCKDFMPNEESLSISFFNASDQANSKFSQFNGEFLHFQLILEVLMRMKQHKKDRKELVSMLKEAFRKNEAALKIVEEFNSNYTPEKAIWWYTRKDFISQSLNDTLRTQNIDGLVASRSFMADIRRQLSYHQCDRPIRAYRGQLLARQELKKYQNSIGQFISINSFFSACLDEDEATKIIQKTSNINAAKTALGDNAVPVLFRIDADPQIINHTSSKPFANISSLSSIKTKNEVLFMAGSIFRLKNVKALDHKISTAGGRLITIIVLELCDHKQHALHELYDSMMKECNKAETDFLSLGRVLLKMGKIDLTEKYVSRMFNELPPNDPLLGDVYHLLGCAADGKGDTDKSLALYEKSLAIKSQTSSTDHVSLCILLNSTGGAYQKKNYLDRALESFNKAVSLFKQANDKNHILMASLYNNIGLIHCQKDLLKEALKFYQQSLTVKERHLPREHPSFAESYNNIGTVYYIRRDYETALNYYKRSLEINLNALPSTHPDIALAYKNIGLVSEDKGDYEQALVNYKSAEKIFKKVRHVHNDLDEIRKDIERASNKARAKKSTL